MLPAEAARATAQSCERESCPTMTLIHLVTKEVRHERASRCRRRSGRHRAGRRARGADGLLVHDRPGRPWRAAHQRRVELGRRSRPALQIAVVPARREDQPAPAGAEMGLRDRDRLQRPSRHAGLFARPAAGRHARHGQFSRSGRRGQQRLYQLRLDRGAGRPGHRAQGAAGDQDGVRPVRRGLGHPESRQVQQGRRRRHRPGHRRSGHDRQRPGREHRLLGRLRAGGRGAHDGAGRGPEAGTEPAAGEDQGRYRGDAGARAAPTASRPRPTPAPTRPRSRARRPPRRSRTGQPGTGQQPAAGRAHQGREVERTTSVHDDSRLDGSLHRRCPTCGASSDRRQSAERTLL